MKTPRLLIVADDLTGALDSAGEAANLGIATHVFLTPAALAAADREALPPVIAVSTGTRDGSATEAAAAMEKVCAAISLLRPEHVMKKVDSRLKGHVGLESAILASALRRPSIVVAPALPDMGRVQRDGLLTGMGVDESIQIQSRFGGLPVIVPDVTDAAEMQQTAGLDGLLVGARSLAAALVARLWPGAQVQRRPPLPGPPVLAIGSRDPITLAQVEQMDLPLCLAPDGRLPPDLPRPPCAVQMIPGQGRAAADAAADFAEGLSNIVVRNSVRTLIACGGETAADILGQLGVDQLQVVGLALPGIAVARAELVGPRKLTVVTKSGGFGTPGTLAQLVNWIDNRATFYEASSKGAQPTKSTQ